MGKSLADGLPRDLLFPPPPVRRFTSSVSPRDFGMSGHLRKDHKSEALIPACYGVGMRAYRELTNVLTRDDYDFSA